MTAGRGPPDPEGMERPTRLPEPGPIRALAVLSGVAGLLAGLFLIGFFTLESYGVRLAGVSLGTINDVLGAIQFATLAPVAWGLGRRLPATRIVRVATGTALIAMAGYVVLSVLLVAGVLTFEQQIGPVIATIVAVYAWLLTVNLVGHRTRTLPRAVTRVGVLLAGGLLTGLVLAGAGYVLPGIGGRLATWLGYGLGGIGWLGLPVYALLLATWVFGRPAPSLLPADHNDHITEGISS
jgi:hypothetical protein